MRYHDSSCFTSPRRAAALSLLVLTLAAVFALTSPTLARSPQSPPATAVQAEYGALAARITSLGLREQGAWPALEKILSVGPRQTGSKAADAAVAVMVDYLKSLGFDHVRTEPTTVGHWVRGAREEGRIVSKRLGTVPVKVRAIGNSIGTPGAGLTAGVVEVHSLAELQQLGDRAKGRIVFFNAAMDPTLLDTFPAYGGAAWQRSGGAVAAARAGGVAAVVRSLTLRNDDDPHTGTMSYDEATPKVPAVTISTAAANRLSEMLQKDPDLQFHFVTSARMLAPVVSHNVLAEIRGSEKPEEVIVVGGHLDSWDLSVGAHDDGAGCAQSIEVLRLIKALGLKPKRTIRAVLYMDEENGGAGGRDYAAAAERKSERHIAAIESDRGGFLPIGFGVGAKGAAYDRIKSWEPLFQDMGLQWIKPGGGGVDIGPLAASGTVMMGLVPDSQRYFDVHHSGIDTLDTVNPRELELGATSMAMLVWLLSEEPWMEGMTTPPAAGAEACNPGSAIVNAAMWMQDSAEYRANTLQAYGNARRALDAALADPSWVGATEDAPTTPVQPPAIILDLDETVLDNSPFEARMIHRGLADDSKAWLDWTSEAAARAVPGAAEFLAYAKSRGVTPFYVTNRESVEREPTLRNLRDLGFPLPPAGAPTTLLLKGDRPEWTNDKTSRRAFVASSYRVVMLFGDDLNDFASARELSLADRDALVTKAASWWGTKWIVLPNPAYGSFDYAVTKGAPTPCAELQKKVDVLREK